MLAQLVWTACDTVGLFRCRTRGVLKRWTPFYARRGDAGSCRGPTKPEAAFTCPPILEKWRIGQAGASCLFVATFTFQSCVLTVCRTARKGSPLTIPCEKEGRAILLVFVAAIESGLCWAECAHGMCPCLCFVRIFVCLTMCVAIGL